MGELSIERDGGGDPAAAPRPRHLALLAMLAGAGSRGMSRERVMAVLWPESTSERGRHALSQTLYRLRRELGGDAVVGAGEDLRLDPAVLRSDLQELRDRVAAGDATGAAGLYGGPFLHGFALVDAPMEFEQWVEDERRRVAAEAVRALEACAAECRDDRERLGWERRLAEVDPLSGRRAASYMRALAAAGDRAAALAHGRDHVAAVRRELDADADVEVTRLIDSLRSAPGAGPAAERPAAPAVARPDRSESATPIPVPRSRSLDPRVAAIAAVGLAVTAVAAVLVTRGGRDAPAVPTLAVGRFVDQTGSDTVRAGGVLTDMLATGLGQLDELRLIANTRLLELMPAGGDTVPGARSDAARRAGAGEILEGELWRLPSGQLRLELRRVDLASGAVRRGYRVEAADRFAVVDSATAVLARDLRVRGAAGPVAALTTGSPIAYRLYEEGLRAYYHYDSYGAYRLFQAALEEDPSFAAAAYFAYRAAEHADPGARDSLGARALATADRAPERERLIVRTQVAADRGDPAALVVAESLLARHPDDPEAMVRAAAAIAMSTTATARVGPLLSRAVAIDSAAGTGPGACPLCEPAGRLVAAYLWADSLDAADREARRFVRLRPDYGEGWRLLAATQLRRGALAEAEASLSRSHALVPPGGRASLWDQLMRLRLWADDYEHVNRECEVRVPSPDPAVAAAARWLCVAALRNQGRYRDAVRLVYEGRWPGVARGGAGAGDRFNQALLDFEMGRWQLAARAWEGMAREARTELVPGRAARNVAWYSTLQGMALAAAGDTASVRRLADSVQLTGARSLFGRDPRLHLFLRGLIDAAAGRDAAAIELFRESVHSWTFGFTRANLELARAALRAGRPADAVRPLQAALRGDVDGSNLYVTRTELHEALARAFAATGQRDSAAAHLAVVERAWRNADPAWRERYQAARVQVAGAPSVR